MSPIDKAKDFAGQHSDQVNQGIDSASQAADQKTGGKHSDHIQQGADQVKSGLGTNQGDGQNQQDQNQQGQKDQNQQ